ncbi:SIMPL domain-containing protein [Microbacterium sp. P07]|uniref:SIMPL domain-containing protein n=1 Tax=Microbacterium sp. P07 TaxID=3366952 RepID=UPI0037477306
MSDVVITVRGEQERRVAPERAVVQLSVRADGPERGPVVERVNAATAPIRDGLETHARSGEVAEWSSGRVSVWSDRPWNNEGRQLAPVHHASVDVSATFADFTALSWWLGETAEADEVQVTAIAWELTPATRATIEREVATDAVGVAVTRAEAYAEALGLGSLTPAEIADVGLLSGQAEASASAPKMMRAMAMDASGPALALQPADIVVGAAVEARFRAS